jgi:lytic murein transglycosylase
MSKSFKLALAAAVWVGLAGTASAQVTCGNTAKGFDKFIRAFHKEAVAAGLGPEAMAALDGVQYDPSIIKKDRAQNIFSISFLDFQAKMVRQDRIVNGGKMIAKYKPLFAAVEKKYGVPPPVIAAFWALETEYGGNIGNLPTVQSLATLAWDCRRPEKFRPQLMAALQLIDRGDLTLAEMRGAWAGEIGQTQFLPYDYNESAVDFDGDGRRDLRNSVPDVIASTASLLRKHGWQPGQPWMHEVMVPEEMDWSQADIAIQHPRSQWAKWGVKSVNGKPIKADKFPASLLLPMGRNGPAFLVYENFTKAYLKWNESLVYSTTAAYLATRIAGAPKVRPGNAPVQHMGYEEIKALQEKLQALGYDVGKIDGKIGAGTRAAVKDQQIKLGMPADSYPTLELLGAL